MKNKGKRFLALLLACALMAGPAAGCQSGENASEGGSSAGSGESSGSAPVEDADPYGPMPERVTLTIGRSEDASVTYVEGENSADNYVVRYMSDKLNIDYKHAFSVPDTEYSNKVSLAITGGDIPDTMTVSEIQLRQLVEADMIEDLTDVMNTYMSDSLKARYDTTDGYAKAPPSTGKSWPFPT